MIQGTELTKKLEATVFHLKVQKKKHTLKAPSAWLLTLCLGTCPNHCWFTASLQGGKNMAVFKPVWKISALKEFAFLSGLFTFQLLKEQLNTETLFNCLVFFKKIKYLNSIYFHHISKRPKVACLTHSHSSYTIQSKTKHNKAVYKIMVQTKICYITVLNGLEIEGQV